MDERQVCLQQPAQPVWTFSVLSHWRWSQFVPLSYTVSQCSCSTFQPIIQWKVPNKNTTIKSQLLTVLLVWMKTQLSADRSLPRSICVSICTCFKLDCAVLNASKVIDSFHLTEAAMNSVIEEADLLMYGLTGCFKAKSQPEVTRLCGMEATDRRASESLISWQVATRKATLSPLKICTVTFQCSCCNVHHLAIYHLSSINFVKGGFSEEGKNI